MTTSTRVSLSSSEARDVILSQHERLRGRLAETIELADRVEPERKSSEREPSDSDTLRAQARKLYAELAAHMEVEEQILPTALRDVVGWGAVLQAQMAEENQRQRATLAAARSALEQAGASAPRLSDHVRTFARAVLFHMETQERGLLQADLDAIATESQGG
jgi:iron-sulfur cluster repair protein YtfE (RIC family)